MQYILQMHSYDFTLLGIKYKHTGYSLAVINDDGSASIQQIDFGSGDLVNITQTEAYAVKDIRERDCYWSSSGNSIQENKIQINTLIRGEDALEIFEEIKAEAALINKANIAYDVIGEMRVCNTAVQYWAEKYIYPHSAYTSEDVFADMEGDFNGKDDNFIEATTYGDKTKLEFISNLISIIKNQNKMDEFLTTNEPYVSPKYLSIIEPFLSKDFLLSNNLSVIKSIVSQISSGVVNLGNFSVLGDRGRILSNQLQSTITVGEGTASPLVVDLDGDGVETKEENSQIYFDHDGNGFAESSGWVGQDDGLLVRDINGNGQIDDGTELFGNNSVLSNGQSAANDNDILFSSKAL